MPWWAWAYRFEQEFTAAYDALGVLRPTYEPRATGHVTEMVELMRAARRARPRLPRRGGQRLLRRPLPAGLRLAHPAVAGEHVTVAEEDVEPDKRGPHDFALWKAPKPGEPATASWPTPFGRGRPGWHLECSTMAQRYLGDTFDIHGGGIDLRFPHHENEQAQSHAAGYGFARYWVHNAWVTVGGEKMSKSLGNSLVVANVLQRTERGGAALRARDRALPLHRGVLRRHLARGRPAPGSASPASSPAPSSGWVRCPPRRSLRTGPVELPGGLRRGDGRRPQHLRRARRRARAAARRQHRPGRAGRRRHAATPSCRCAPCSTCSGWTRWPSRGARERPPDGLGAERSRSSTLVAGGARRARRGTQTKDWQRADALRDQLRTEAGVVVEDCAGRRPLAAEGDELMAGNSKRRGAVRKAGSKKGAGRRFRRPAPARPRGPRAHARRPRSASTTRPPSARPPRAERPGRDRRPAGRGAGRAGAGRPPRGARGARSEAETAKVRAALGIGRGPRARRRAQPRHRGGALRHPARPRSSSPAACRPTSASPRWCAPPPRWAPRSSRSPAATSTGSPTAPSTRAWPSRCRRTRTATSPTCSPAPSARATRRSSSRSTASPTRTTSGPCCAAPGRSAPTASCVPERRSAGVTATAWKVSAGAAARVPVARATNLVRALTGAQGGRLLRRRARRRRPTSVGDLELATEPLVLVTGSEGKGLTRLVRETCDVVAVHPDRRVGGVPQRRRRHRHRLYEVARHRRQA